MNTAHEGDFNRAALKLLICHDDAETSSQASSEHQKFIIPIPNCMGLTAVFWRKAPVCCTGADGISALPEWESTFTRTPITASEH